MGGSNVEDPRWEEIEDVPTDRIGEDLAFESRVRIVGLDDGACQRRSFGVDDGSLHHSRGDVRLGVDYEVGPESE